ncbi:PREDICTED: uncharacterized protein LOC108559849 [Nicrophorus vespilloides]|uniref:Uncharacterized protein LOC108559849 n=1 Tax=Nicrophorus vespilloides TaxID=110193 RepID=A0ABM1MDQ5_NICVS|nr:PREDICTED: uncharacterized protein LOC108559849 [Nicrophorus vespilloides]XP_017772706.1 PREDICTED: uncharacterized protein LOC108559849 [Nicrophorus vespilloides]XP_017772707.1 PREDICTED: uncharacterized protein LOC108559849 [Nicrophorus vespilloides]
MDIHDKTFHSYSADSIEDDNTLDYTRLLGFGDHKCQIIKLVRHQIRGVDKRVKLYLVDVKWCNSYTGCLYRYRYMLLGILCTLILLYFALIYGAVMGSTLCVKSTKGNCCKVGYLPGLKYVPNEYNTY